ncbi:MAG: response regulator [Thermodesulfobacteriota bacterium]
MDDGPPLIMIVDDEPDMCWALEHILRKRGHPSKKASNGREAMKLLELYKFRMAFVDMKLPDMEGLELARRMKSLDPATLIVMISGLCYKDDPAVQEALKEQLILDFIAKPFLHADIDASIENANSRALLALRAKESTPQNKESDP